jgi:glycosyltransferase involved in cell wall biosynthesis
MLELRRRAASADVVHFQWLAVPPLDAALLPRGRPLVLTAHDPLPPGVSAAGRAAARRALARFDAVVAHSRRGAQRLATELGVAPERIHVIPHGAFTHLAALPPGPLPPELSEPAAPVVLCFGLVRPYKGIDVLLDAWRSVAGAELWIVGRPRVDVSALRAAAPAGVHWVPRYVSDAELAACFRRAALAVLPYRDSEQSGVLATALAFGVPLVLSDVGGFGEVAAAGAARLVAPGDAAALAAAIGELLGDAAARERLGAAGLALAAGEWSWPCVARRTLDLYASLTGAPAPAPVRSPD